MAVINPATIQMALMLASAFGLGGRKDNRLKNMLDMLVGYSDPRTITADAKRYFEAWQSSPAYTAARGAINVGANRAASDVAGSNAMRGLTGTGIGAIMSGLGSNTAGFKLGELNAKAWEEALRTASTVASSRLQGAGYLQLPRDIQGDTFGGLLDWFGKQDLSKIKWGGTKKSSLPPAPPGWGDISPDPISPRGTIANFAQLMGR